jgi:hypothetical protein
MGHMALNEQCDPTERQGEYPNWGEKDMGDHLLSPWGLAQNLQGQSLKYGFSTLSDVQALVLNWVVQSELKKWLLHVLMNREMCYCTMGPHYRWMGWAWWQQYWGSVAPVEYVGWIPMCWQTLAIWYLHEFNEINLFIYLLIIVNYNHKQVQHRPAVNFLFTVLPVIGIWLFKMFNRKNNNYYFY